MNEEEIAKLSYQAYGQVTGNKNFQGNPMPDWENLPEKIQHAWIFATQTARDL